MLLRRISSEDTVVTPILRRVTRVAHRRLIPPTVPLSALPALDMPSPDDCAATDLAVIAREAGASAAQVWPHMVFRANFGAASQRVH
jgi:hypothetical protein